MDIKPTIVEVKDIVILDHGDGKNVLIQVLGYETATSPLQVPLSVLLSLSNAVAKIEPNNVPLSQPNEPVEDVLEDSSNGQIS